jgi:hypothetical protein
VSLGEPQVFLVGNQQRDEEASVSETPDPEGRQARIDANESVGEELRAAKTQSLFREVNERMESLTDSFAVVASRGSFICECAHETCAEQIGLSLEEYEAVRADGTTFAVAPADEHVFPGVERVAAKHDGYWVVAKTGVAAAVAEKFDPRQRDGRGAEASA